MKKHILSLIFLAMVFVCSCSHAETYGRMRVMGDLKAGVMQLVSSTILTQAASTITISGLDGNTAEEYELRCRFVSGDNSNYYCVIFNSDSGTNYGKQRLIANNTSESALRIGGVNYIKFSDGVNLSTGDVNFGYLKIYAKSGKCRTALLFESVGISGTTVTQLTMAGWVWNNSADNITTITVYSGVSNGLGAGTSVELYKKVSKI